jgi:hypothetical protein
MPAIDSVGLLRPLGYQGIYARSQNGTQIEGDRPMPDEIFTPRFWLSLTLAATAYVRITWWLARRRTPFRFILPWLGATAICALVAAAVQGPSSPDEMFLPRPFTARSEAALFVSVIALPAFGLATLSVRRRFPHRASGEPTAADMVAGVLACFCGAGLLFTALIGLTLLLLP